MNRRIRKKKTMQRVMNENIFLRDHNRRLIARNARLTDQMDELQTVTYGIIACLIGETITLTREDISRAIREKNVVVEPLDGAFKISVEDICEENTER